MSLGQVDPGHLCVFGHSNDGVAEEAGKVRVHLLDRVLLDLNQVLEALLVGRGDVRLIAGILNYLNLTS